MGSRNRKNGRERTLFGSQYVVKVPEVMLYEVRLFLIKQPRDIHGQPVNAFHRLFREREVLKRPKHGHDKPQYEYYRSQSFYVTASVWSEFMRQRDREEPIDTNEGTQP